MEYMYIKMNAHEDIQICAAYFNLFQHLSTIEKPGMVQTEKWRGSKM